MIDNDLFTDDIFLGKENEAFEDDFEYVRKVMFNSYSFQSKFSSFQDRCRSNKQDNSQVPAEENDTNQ